jgi:hypothetical protein
VLRPITPYFSCDLNGVISRFFDILKFLTHVVSKDAGLILEMKEIARHRARPSATDINLAEGKRFQSSHADSNRPKAWAGVR